MKRNHSKRWLLSLPMLALAFTLPSQPANAAAPLTAAQATANQTEALTDRIIVKFKASATGLTGATIASGNLEQLAPNSGLRLSHVRRTANGAQVLALGGFKTAADVSAVVAELSARADVEYAEPDLLMHPLATPSDPLYSSQWHYYEATGGLNLPAAWDVTSGAGVVVGVIDTGYRPHADLAANLLPGYDMISDTFVSVDGDGRDSDATDPGDWSSAGTCSTQDPGYDSSWHGTHVAGTIAAVTNNGLGVAGIAYSAKVVPVRVLGRCGGYTSDIADGMIWAAGGSVSGLPANSNPAQVLNLSLGGSGSCGSTTQAAINTARSLGTTVVVAAGNANTNAANATPANCSGVITVAATGRTGAKAYYSNYGSVVDVAAPGGDMSTGTANGVLSTLNDGATTPGTDSYAYYQGTSMATPHVVGTVALLYSVDPSITPDEVETALKATARDFPGTCNQCGAGIVDAAAAVAYVAGGGDGGGGGGGTTGLYEANLSGSRNSWQDFVIEVPAGTSTLTASISGGSGDADLYVRYDAAPSRRRYDCRPYLNGNDESCTISNPAAGTWYISIYGYRAYSGVTLVAE
ncbi:S8 family peptidase [Halioxenophilus sp. WMMB6]|uniref:S8 family peptidase n=1 Tax=Halioxenophilus sp. WMMB6 TaxID=3073815 RepID=UPI00295E772C|nr:S8 family peptidase [Halioxenophilus sp. WMMB6]